MPVQPELVLIALLAIAPPSLYAAATARFAHPGERDRLGAAIAFVWGAVVASSLAAILNDRSVDALARLVGAARTHAVVPAIVGPAVEEGLKAAGIVAALVAGIAMRPVRDAIATGAIVGFGFAATENITYYTLAALQGGWEGLGRAVYLRGLVEGANHAAFTAVAGAGIGRSWAPGIGLSSRIAAAALGLAGAITVHAVWNGVVSAEITTVLCNAPAPDVACAAAPDAGDLLLRVPALEAAFLLPLAGALRWLARRA